MIHHFHNLIKPHQSEQLLSEFCTLIALHPPHPPGVKETRHAEFSSWEASLPPGTPCGVICLTIHNQAGRPVPFWDPGISSHLLEGWSVREATASVSFRSSAAIRELSEQISIIFAALDPATWQRYRQVYFQTAEVFPLEMMDHSPVSCFVAYYLLVNLLTTLHYDSKDPPLSRWLDRNGCVGGF